MGWYVLKFVHVGVLGSPSGCTFAIQHRFGVAFHSHSELCFIYHGTCTNSGRGAHVNTSLRRTLLKTHRKPRSLESSPQKPPNQFNDGPTLDPYIIEEETATSKNYVRTTRAVPLEGLAAHSESKEPK